MDFLKWLYPGLRIKRWLSLGVIGFIFTSVGMSIISNTSVLSFIEIRIKSISSYFFNNYLLGGGIVLILGILLLVISFREVVRSFIKAVFPEFARTQVRPVHQARFLQRGPKIVVIGGGTGLSILLRGLKIYTSNITAIVSVADDGGSSGRLRSELGILPPGDIRNCIIALADKEALMEKLLNYRFQTGGELKGHNLGNLFLAAMTDMYGNFEEAVSQMGKVLAIRGKVIPSTLEQIILKAELLDGTIIKGESNISKTKVPIKKVVLEPENVKPLKEGIKAIQEADVIVLGPGSLYTSIIPNLLVPGIKESVQNSNALKLYVCNVMTQPGETEGFTASKHLETILDYGGKDLVQYILVNNQPVSNSELLKKYIKDGAEPVKIDKEKLFKLGVKVLEKPLIDETNLIRHNSYMLAAEIIKLFLAEKKKGISLSFIDKLILLEKTKFRNEGIDNVIFLENKKRTGSYNT